jgi:hypothetical protein
MVWPATQSPKTSGPDGLLDGNTSVDSVRIHERRRSEYVVGESGCLVET